MLIIPVENKPDWRHPPVVTLLVVLVNVWVYFGLLDDDEAAYADARQAYVASGLIQREAPHFRAYYRLAYPADDRAGLPEAPDDLVDYVLLDLGFDGYVAERMAGDAEWQRNREAFERRRDELSWIAFGLVPEEAAWWSYLTSMFLHGSVDHLIGNMVFLFIFGFALERALGTLNYTAVYLLGGLGGGVLHVLINQGSHIPAIGASGAVSALMGAYLAVYQLRRIRFFYSVLVYFGEFTAPALLVLPLWLAKEVYGYLYGAQGIAYWDHVGGLLAGAALGWLAMRLSHRVDTNYLERGGLEAASRAQIKRLDALIDAFKYDQARALAASHLAEHPGDVNTWRKYLELVSADKADPEYHRVVKRVLGLSASNPDADTARLIDETYRSYASGKHPKPALNDARLLCALGEQLARTRKLDDARRIANRLLEADRREPEVAGLLRVLGNKLAEAGSGALARHYFTELSARFGEAS